MATEELRDLRQRYKAAYAAYMSSVDALSQASERGVWPSPEVIEAEAVAFTELALVRHTLLEVLRGHTKNAKPSG